MKTVKQARQEAYEELSKPKYKEIRNAMLQDIIELFEERLKQLEKETEIDWRKEFEDMVRYIGVVDYGKERWFRETEKSGRVRWYDRYDGEYLTTDELQQRIYEVVRKLDE